MPGQEGAAAFLTGIASKVTRWGITDSAAQFPSPPEWPNFEVMAYLGSRNKVTKADQKTIVDCWHQEAGEESDYVAKHARYLGIDQPPTFWGDHRIGPWEGREDAAIDAAILRTISNCDIADGIVENAVRGWERDTRTYSAERWGVTERSLLSLFHLVRSDLVLQRARPWCEDEFVQMCGYRPAGQEWPWMSTGPLATNTPNLRWAALMLFIGARLESGPFFQKLAPIAINLIIQEQRSDGSWLALTADSARPSIFVTASAMHGLLLTESDGWNKTAAVEWLWSRQGANGSWSEGDFDASYLTVLVLDAIDLAEEKPQLTFSVSQSHRLQQMLRECSIARERAELTQRNHSSVQRANATEGGKPKRQSANETRRNQRLKFIDPCEMRIRHGSKSIWRIMRSTPKTIKPAQARCDSLGIAVRRASIIRQTRQIRQLKVSVLFCQLDFARKSLPRCDLRFFWILLSDSSLSVETPIVGDTSLATPGLMI
jgi:hypothetical protein